MKPTLNETPPPFRASRLTRKRRLFSDRRGAAIPEFAMAITPILWLMFGMIQWCTIAYVHLILKHAAFVAARCEAVKFPDMPDSGKCGTDSFKSLFASVNHVHADQLKFEATNPGQKTDQTMNSVTVSLDYECKVPLGNNIACGRKHRMPMSATATFPNQGSTYQTVWASVIK